MLFYSKAREIEKPGRTLHTEISASEESLGNSVCEGVHKLMQMAGNVSRRGSASHPSRSWRHREKADRLQK